jgi:L-seryl-tRNA(Ser) seleniumtransferase
MSSNPLRDLPSVARLLELPLLVEARKRHSHQLVASAARLEIDKLRRSLLAGEVANLDSQAIAERIALTADLHSLPAIHPIINATGIVLHTNLGRSPLHEVAAQAAYEAARSYLNLELDLETGQRSSRQDAIRSGLCDLTGAEAATAVNNCAAATVIALRAIAAGKEVVVSRGQLIEIGGSFRIPEIMAVSGATLREVGTTNVTRSSDYERAIGANTAVLMRIHTSNFAIRGFTKSVELAELVDLGRKHNLTVIDDVGSGQVVDLAPFGMPGEPLVPASIRTGADLVLFSGDKLMGGPQCGLIVGKAKLIECIERDPLMRAFRLDKMTLAALEATLRIYRDPERALREIPTLRMLAAPIAELRERCERFATRLRTLPEVTVVEVCDDVAYVGGGSLPDVAVPTSAIAVRTQHRTEGELATRLRTGRPAVVGRIRAGQFLLDLRTVFERQEDDLFEALARAVQTP